ESTRAAAGDARVAVGAARWSGRRRVGARNGPAPRALAGTRGGRRRRRRACDRIDLPRRRPAAARRAAQRLDALMDSQDGPRFLSMIALVAAVVAVVILVFFALGYAFGRLFL